IVTTNRIFVLNTATTITTTIARAIGMIIDMTKGEDNTVIAGFIHTTTGTTNTENTMVIPADTKNMITIGEVSRMITSTSLVEQCC
ncbi:hypothetical protein, partial [Porticoccus sp.]|uniref:hypothetical protein n=1 Tax=Porticoccus sp. TaxID=2024853 RepID=UPI003F6A3013